MKKLRANFESKPHYGIRKLTIGVASVVVGLSFLGFTSDIAKADTNSETAAVVENKQSEDSAEENTASKSETVSPVHNDQEDTKNASESTSVEKKEEASKLTDSVSSDKEKTTVHEKTTETTLAVVTGTDDQNQIVSTQELLESKYATSDNQKAELGKSPVNVDDWKYNTDTNQDINLTDYIGNDKVNIVIPNDQDFIKAGKLEQGHAVKISSKTMHNLIAKDKPTSVIISKTNNGKVVAADADWSNAFGGSDTSKDSVTSGITLTDPNLTALDVTNLDTHNITNFRKMFYYGDKLTTVGDLSKWDVSNSESFAMMFRNASALTNIGDLSDWNVSKCTDFTGMFNQARHIENLGDLSQWNVSNSKSFANMFRDTWNLHDIGDVSNWNVSNSTSTEWMFGNSALDRINISGWDLSNVTNFSDMFQGEPFKEVKVYNDSTKEWSWIPQTVHHDKIVIANNIKLSANADKVLTAHDFAGGNSHQFVITNNDILLNLKIANINNDINIMDKQNDVLFAFVMPSFFKVNDMNHLEDEIKAQIIQRLKAQIADYNNSGDSRGILSWTDKQLDDLVSPITNDLTISDNKQIGALTLTTQNGDKIEDITVPVIWNLAQVEKNVTRKVIARLPNGEDKLLKTQVVRYYREVLWDKLLIDTPIEFTDWKVVPGTIDYWKQLILTDQSYTPTEEEKDTTDVVDASIPGYDFDPAKTETIDENVTSDNDSATVDWNQKVGPNGRNEYIYLHYAAKKYHANFKYIDSDGHDYPRFQYSLDPLAQPPVEEEYNGTITVPDTYKNLPKFFKDKHLEVSYIEVEGHHYGPKEDLTKLKYSFTKDTNFIYHLVPNASVITYKDVTGLTSENDYDSKGVVITDSVIKGKNIDLNSQKGWDYKAENWTYVKSSISPNKVNLTVYLKANDKSINRMIKYVDSNGKEFLSDEPIKISVTHKLGEFKKDLSPKYEGSLGDNSIFNIPRTKEINGQTYYFDIDNSHFSTSAEKGNKAVANNGITVNKLAKTISVNVPQTVEDGTNYIFVLPYVQSHINVIYKDVTDVDDNTKAKNIEGHDKPIKYTDQPGMPFVNDKGWNYGKDNWVLVSTSKKPGIFAGKDGNYTQDYVIYLKHGTVDAERKDTVTETIHYVYENGQKAQDDSIQIIDFTETGVTDKVTNITKWNVAKSQKFNDVKSHEIIGYTPDSENVVGKTVNFDDQDIELTVVYRIDNENAVITYIDDVNGHNLKQDKASGKFNTNITFDTDPQDQIKTYETQGYKLVSNDYNNNLYHEGKNEFFVHLTHNTELAARTDSVIRTIHYIYENGTKVANDNIQTVSFKENGVQDLVTKNIEWKNATAQNFNNVISPVITGYTPDKENVAGETVNFGDKDIEITVTYHANHQTAHIIFRDDDSQNDLEKKDISGKTDEAIDFSDAQKSFDDYLLNRGFEFVNLSDETASRNNASDINDEILTTKKEDVKNYQNKFGNPYEQFFVIHLKHGVRDTKPGDKNKDGSDVVLTGEATAIIHYVDEDGNKVDDDSVQTIKFNRTGQTDAVTGQVIKLNPWMADKAFVSISSPEISGYTANQDEVLPATPMTPEADDQEYTVVYAKNEQGSEEHHDGGDSDDNNQPDPSVENPTSGDSDEFDNPSDWEEDTAEKDTYAKNTRSHYAKLTHKNKLAIHVEKTSTHVTSYRDVFGKAEFVTRETVTSASKNKHVVTVAAHNLDNKQAQAESELPETGEKQNQAGLIGLAFASFAGLLGLAGKRRKNK